MPTQPRIDWFRVFVDLDRAGYTLRMVSATLSIPYTTLKSRANGGHEPRHQDGEAITTLWCRVKQRPADELPRVVERESLSAARVR